MSGIYFSGTDSLKNLLTPTLRHSLYLEYTEGGNVAYDEKGTENYFFCPFMRLYYHKIAIISRLPIFGFVYYNHILT